jgi:regulator of protease activity HflC (stomatin/prohibitin superfamily)
MKEFGFDILKALVTDIDPDEKVKRSMNEINAAKRMKEAAKEKAEAEKIKVVAAAQAEAESKKLQGEGIANQRIAIANGIKQSVEEIRGVMDKDVTSQSVMNMLFLTQHYDTIAKLSENGVNTIFVPYSPNSVGDLQTQIMSSMLAAENYNKVVANDKANDKEV